MTQHSSGGLPRILWFYSYGHIPIAVNCNSQKLCFNMFHSYFLEFHSYSLVWIVAVYICNVPSGLSTMKCTLGVPDMESSNPKLEIDASMSTYRPGSLTTPYTVPHRLFYIEMAFIDYFFSLTLACISSCHISKN